MFSDFISIFLAIIISVIVIEIIHLLFGKQITNVGLRIFKIPNNDVNILKSPKEIRVEFAEKLSNEIKTDAEILKEAEKLQNEMDISKTQKTKEPKSMSKKKTTTPIDKEKDSKITEIE